MTKMKVFRLIVYSICLCFTGFAQGKWWNVEWHFRSSIPGSIQPVLDDICAAKVDFIALLKNVSAVTKKVDISSIRLMGEKKDGTVSETKFDFIPHPNFDPVKDARGTLVWEKIADIEKYWLYFDVLDRKEKPVSAYKTNIDINLVSGGSFDQGIGQYKIFGDATFDPDNGFLKKGCVKLKKKKDTDQSSYIFSPFFPAEPETSYDLVFFGKGHAEQPNNFAIVAYVNFYDENNKYIDRAGAKLETRSSFDWTPYTMSVKTVPKTKKIALHIQTYQETGYVWIDDIRITPAVNYIVGNIETQSGPAQSVSGSKIPFDFVEIKYPDFYKPEAPIEPEEQKLGFYIWESRPEIIIYPYTKAPAIRKREIRAWGTPGERVNRSFCIRPFENIDSVKIEITGDVKNLVDVREMKYLARKHLGKTYHVVPCYLDKISGKIEKGITTQYYLTFSIPDNAKPGIYNGNLKITTGTSTKQNNSFSMPISLRILPFRLIKPDDVYWGFFYGNYDWNTAYGTTPDRKVFYPEQEPLMFENMVKHNANLLGISGCVPTYEKKDNRYVFDFTKVTPGRGNLSLKETLDNAAKAGFKCILIDLPNDIYHSKIFDAPFMSEMWQNLYVQLIQDTMDFIKKNKYPFSVYFLLVDEPANSQKLTDDAITLCKIVKARVKDAKIYETLHTQTLHKIGPLVDACMMYAEQLNESIIETIKNMGKELWSDNGGSFGRDYRVDRFYTGFYQFKIGAKAIGQWAYMWPKGPDAYDDFNPKNRGGAHAGDYYALPSPEGPKDTPGLEGFCDGIYDYMYLYTLEKTIEKIKRTKNKEKIKEAENAWTEITKEILDTIPVEYKRDFVNSEDFQPDRIDAWRWKIAQKIMSLEGLK
ncbi:MAG: hypothetical protein NC906_05510 [Candidatus Omnitrophica bacterium]|nr:hypothetical protein [Candidatus Omnitrophota bacterium]